MGYMIATGNCFGCGRLFDFNPERVPSIRDPRTNEREPICRACVERVNPTREQRGLEPIRVVAGAYEPEEVG